MDLIQSLKEKSELDRQRFEAELPVLAERVAHGEATEKEVAAWLKSSGLSLDDLQRAVDRQLKIDELRNTAALFRERSLEAYRIGLQAGKHRAFSIKVRRDLESETNRLRSLGWQVGLQADESRMAYRTLAQMTGQLHPIPDLSHEYRALDAEFADELVAEPAAVPSHA